MALKSNYYKLKEHLRSGGILYAFFRGLKYLIFKVKKTLQKIGIRAGQGKNIKEIVQIPDGVISKGKIKIVCSGYGLNVYLDEAEVTQGVGLNAGINSLGFWTDSSKARWKVLEKGVDCFKLEVKFEDLPITQVWHLKIEKSQEISWQIEMFVQDDIYIDEMCMVCLLSPNYKSWINNYKQADFPRLTPVWYNVPLDETPSCLVGVRFPKEAVSLPSFTLELSPNKSKDVYPVIQNAPLEINAHLIGFRKNGGGNHPGKGKDYTAGKYDFFSAKINLFEDNYSLDEKIEFLRQNLLRSIMKGEIVKGRKKSARKKISLLLVNLPWQRNGQWGVRAGSRWPHIKDKSEGDYLPFPFFLAYAASLLQKHNIEVTIIDAIAEEMPEDVLMEKILNMTFDYLVTETSVPSFYDDLRMLERIHKAGISIILCGPNSEIYTENFLKKNLFVDFVLYGEYEFTLLELIQHLKSGKDLAKVKGLIYRQGGKIFKNPKRALSDINLLPWPDRKQLPMNKYWDLPGNIPLPSVQMLASRGCPFGCNFCLWPQVMYQGSHYRTRSVTDVVEEMEYLIKERNFKSVYFDDDTFNVGKERMLRFCQLVKEKKLQDTPWAIMARPDLMDEEILKKMKSAGLWAVKYGVESISNELLNNCHKNMDFQKTDKMIKKTKELGIKTHLTFTFGIAGETKESIRRTIDYAIGLEPNSVQFSILTPFPGTKLFEELDKQGRILVKDYSQYDGHYHCVFKPDNLTAQDLERAKRSAYRLWGEHIRKKRGLRGDLERFRKYLKGHGFRSAVLKTLDYLGFIWIKRKRYANGDD